MRNKRTYVPLRIALIAFALLVVAGYVIGASMAERDNARDAATAEGTR